MVETRPGADFRDLVGNYKFPDLRTKEDLMKVGHSGYKILREISKGLDPEKKKNFVTGNYMFTLGYLAEMFGGREGFAGKRIVDVAGGGPNFSGNYYVGSTFQGSQARVLSELGSEVLAIDPVLKPGTFKDEGYDNITEDGRQVQEVVADIEAGKIPYQTRDVLISTAFLGGPDFLKQVSGEDNSYLIDLLKQMSKLARYQVHYIQQGEIDLSTVNKEQIEQAGIGKVVYNLNVARSLPEAFHGLNDEADFLVIENFSE